jgi:hypothetical protein
MLSCVEWSHRLGQENAASRARVDQ